MFSSDPWLYQTTMYQANRSKGLDLRVPEELQMEIRNTVQEAVVKTISMKKKRYMAKWFSKEAL